MSVYLVLLEDSVLSFCVFVEGRMKLSMREVGVSSLFLVGLSSLLKPMIEYAHSLFSFSLLGAAPYCIRSYKF
jgi:hypothetical protein